MTRSKARCTLCLATSALLCAMPAFGQSGNRNTSTAPGTVSGTISRSNSNGSYGDMQGASNLKTSDTADKMFVRKALRGDMAEIQLAQLAQQKASSSQVKQFADRIITDHTRLDNQIKPVAQQLGIQPPTSLSPRQQQLVTMLQRLSGKQFDRGYMQAMVRDHTRDLQEFRKEAKSAADPQVKEAASQGEPIIAEHLKMARSIDSGSKTSQGAM